MMSCFSPITIVTRDQMVISIFECFCGLPEFLLDWDRSTKLEDRVLGTSSKV